MPFGKKIFEKWTLPSERDFGWKMKPLNSAKTSFTVDSEGVFKLNIEHDPIKGVTPKMLLWWFRNIAGEITYQGKSYPRYLVWHPRDHIHWSLVKKKTDNFEGSYFRIVEAFGRDRKFLIDSTAFVDNLDETGIRLVKQIGKIEVFTLKHEWTKAENSSNYNSEMTVGLRKKSYSKIFNSCIGPLFFTKDMGNAWLKHNIEEVGNFEFFLPKLYEAEIAKIEFNIEKNNKNHDLLINDKLNPG